MPLLDLILDLFLKLVLPAMLASAVGAALAVTLLPLRWQPLGVVWAVCLGVALGNTPVRQTLPFLPDDTGWPWLLPSLAIALLASGIRYSLQLTPYTALLVNIGVVLIAVRRLYSEEMLTFTWVLPFLILVCAATYVLERIATRKPSAIVPASWGAILAGGAAAVSILSHSGRFADAATLLSAALIGVALVAIWRPVDASPLALATSLFLSALMLLGYDATSSFSEVPRASFLLVAGAPLFLLFTELPQVRDLPPKWQAAIQCGLLALPISIAVALAVAYEGV